LLEIPAAHDDELITIDLERLGIPCIKSIDFYIPNIKDLADKAIRSRKKDVVATVSPLCAASGLFVGGFDEKSHNPLGSEIKNHKREY
jgi:hypothetical protein